MMTFTHFSAPAIDQNASGSKRTLRRVVSLAASLTIAAGLAACGGISPDAANPDAKNIGTPTDSHGAPLRSAGSSEGSIFGPGGMFGKKSSDNGGGAPGVAVNAFLWRASLDTIAFMPLASADPFGGVVITDWYANPDTPNERFKVNVFILSRDLQSDGLRVSVFHQVKSKDGMWADSTVPSDMATKLENAILLRARQLRSQATAG